MNTQLSKEEILMIAAALATTHPLLSKQLLESLEVLDNPPVASVPEPTGVEIAAKRASGRMARFLGIPLYIWSFS